MNEKINNLFEKDKEELEIMCTNLVEKMKAYMSNDLDYQTIQSLKDTSLDAVFEIADRITEMDGTYRLLDVDDSQFIKTHANLTEALLGTLEELKEIFGRQ